MASENPLRQIPLAIIGMACRVPGANNLDQFWNMLIEGRSAVVDLPPERFDRELYFDSQRGVRNKSYSCRGAVLNHDADLSEPSPIPPQLDRQADSTHRVLCRVAVEALRHARLDPFDLPQRNAGVYVGHTLGSDQARMEKHVLSVEDAAQCLEALPELTPPVRNELCRQLVAGVRAAQPGTEDSSDAAHRAAGLVAKTLGLSGPFMAVNAACASSLEALVLAGRALQLGQIDMALVGGSSVCSRDWMVLFSQAQALSDSDSRPFDHRADGLIVAEASVMLVVKTLEQALADGDPIQAVIRGLGIASDGRGRSLWAPRSEGQVAAMRRAYHPGVDLADTQYIEAHATATQLGDATEIASLRQVFEGTLPTGKKIPIASVKANIGHTLEAAGLVGMIKTVLCMQKGVIPKAINVEKLNPKVDWPSAPVFVPLETLPWPQPTAGKPRRAGVNAFGIGGLNVHVVLESHDPAATPASPPTARENQADDQAVAVIGLGCVFPGANDVATFGKLLRAGPETNGHRPTGPRLIAGFDYDWRRHRIAPKEIELADPLQFMVLDAVDQALHGAGYDGKPFDRQQTGVVVGTEFAGDFGHRLQLTLNLPHTQSHLHDLLVAQGIAPIRAAEMVAAIAEAWHTRWPVLLDNSGSYSASSLAVRIAKTWDLMGGAVAVDSGSTSAMSALQVAIDLLLCGDCNTVVCAAGQRNVQTALGTGHAPIQGLPFDRYGSGFVPGEGAGVLLLKRLSDAQRDGDPIHAILRGVGAAHDDPAHALSRAMTNSFDNLSTSAHDLSLVVCDACGDPSTDEQLLRGVIDSQIAERNNPLRLSSVVGQFGHTGGASGMASLLAAVIALEDGMAPAASGVESLSTLAQRNKNLVQCAGSAAPLTSGISAHPMTSAVISQGEDLAYCAVIEQSLTGTSDRATAPSPAEEVSPALASQHAESNGSVERIALADVAGALVGQLVELTGYPPEVLDFDADLQADLSIRPEETLQLVSQVQHHLALKQQDLPTPQRLRTLRQVLDFLQGSRKASSNGHPHSSGNGHASPALSKTAAKKTIARRCRLEVVEAPWPTGPTSRFAAHGAVLILGDNPAADALRQRLEADGAAVHMLRPAEGTEAVLAALQALLAETPVRHVFILTALDAGSESLLELPGWQARRALGLELPVLVVQKWRQRLAQDRIAAPITIAAATMLGGDFGIAAPVAAPEGGWVAGFLKSVNVELNRHQQPTTVKVCDFAPTDRPQAIASALLRELATQQPEVEVALSGSRRQVLRAVEQGTEQLPRFPLERGATWVVTGGARGITAEVAVKLGLEYGLKLHLVGRSAAPSPDAPWRNCTPDELKSIKRSIVRQAIAEGKSPEKQWDRVKNDIEIDKNLTRMRTLGLQASYHACDVSDWAALDAVLREVRSQSGPIAGIVHGAGFARTSRLEMLKRENLASTMDSKIGGALGLMRLTWQDPLRYFVGFGSISGRFGGNGLSDYAAANGMLASLCAWFRTERPDCATTCIDWLSWDEVGMAMLPDSSVGTRGVLKMKFIPPAEGVEHLNNELCAGLPEREILIDDGEFERALWTGTD